MQTSEPGSKLEFFFLVRFFSKSDLICIHSINDFFGGVSQISISSCIHFVLFKSLSISSKCSNFLMSSYQHLMFLGSVVMASFLFLILVNDAFFQVTVLIHPFQFNVFYLFLLPNCSG